MALLQLLKVSMKLNESVHFSGLNLFLAKVDDVLGGKPELDTFKRGSDKVYVVFKRGCN